MACYAKVFFCNHCLWSSICAIVSIVSICINRKNEIKNIKKWVNLVLKVIIKKTPTGAWWEAAHERAAAVVVWEEWIPWWWTYDPAPRRYIKAPSIIPHMKDVLLAPRHNSFPPSAASAGHVTRHGSHWHRGVFDGWPRLWIVFCKRRSRATWAGVRWQRRGWLMAAAHARCAAALRLQDLSCSTGD